MCVPSILGNTIHTPSRPLGVFVRALVEAMLDDVVFSSRYLVL